MKSLRKYREQRGWSQAELARRAEIHATSVSLFESGRLVPYAGQVEKLISALGLSESQAQRLRWEAKK